MFKFTFICSLIIVAITTAAKAPANCKPSDQLLPDVDPNYFKFCDRTTGNLYLGKCNYGSGFIRNETASGCVPFEQWPENCIAQVPTVPKCIGNNLLRPSSTTNPNEYYLCAGENSEPILLSCPGGQGFLNVPGTVGCADFSVWRSIKNCTE